MEKATIKDSVQPEETSAVISEAEAKEKELEIEAEITAKLAKIYSGELSREMKASEKAREEKKKCPWCG